MQQTLATILFPEYRRRILGMLLLHPEDALHGREIARRAGLPAGTVSRELATLAEVGLLRRERRGNQHIYSADVACPIHQELASILRKTSGVRDVLADALEPLAPQLVCAFIFGSVAQGVERPGSDVDVLVIGDAGFALVVQALHPAEAAVGRSIHPVVLSQQEFSARVHTQGFLRDVLAKPKLFLIGNDDELAQLAGPQP